MYSKRAYKKTLDQVDKFRLPSAQNRNINRSIGTRIGGLDSYISLNRSLSVTEDCIDKSFDISVAGFAGKLLTPHDGRVLLARQEYLLSEPITNQMIG